MYAPAPLHPRRTFSPVLLAAIVLTVTLTAIVGSLSLLGAAGGPPPAGAPVATESDEPSQRATPSATPRPTPSPTPRPRPTPTATPTPTPEPTAAPTPEPTAAPTTPAAQPTQGPVTPQPTVAPATPPPSSPGLPACTYDDVLTRRHAYAEWAITLLDTIYTLPAGYWPPDLVDSSAAGLNGGYPIRALIADDLRAMAAAAAAAGTPIQIVSGFRSYEQQQATFNYWVSVGGYEQALRTSARAGHSEHQLGTAIDVTSLGGSAPWEHADWATTPAGAWMAANAWRYGFVMSYPNGAFGVTCYDYEPWHYRYVGRDLAQAITASGLTTRQVLWDLQD
jgi:D-alanyl-D-alanine carboxypeptidase